MEKPCFYHRFKIEMPVRAGFYEAFVAFVKDFCAQREIRVEWVRTVELDGYVSVSFILRGDYMIPTMLVSLGYLWQIELQELSKQ